MISILKTGRSTPLETATLQFGRLGEQLAAGYLMRQKYLLTAANFTVPVGRNRRGAIVNAEIDLVAYDGETLCFIEVKTRRSDLFAAPEANVDLRKQRQITRAARAYRKIFYLRDAPFRYDVVGIVLPDEAAKPQIELFKGFWTEDKFRKRRWMHQQYE